MHREEQRLEFEMPAITVPKVKNAAVDTEG
jgi:hypothetical protein